MMENNQSIRQDYRTLVSEMGKKEFTLLKMQEYGFWPKDLPTPYEKQESETKEDYKRRKELLDEYEKTAQKIADLYIEEDKINEKLRELRKQYSETWDYEKIRKDVAKKIMEESIERRAKRRKEREIEKIKVSNEWKKYKAENIVFIGKGYSSLLSHKDNDEAKLNSLGLPIIKDDRELANLLEIDYKELRFLTYHRDVVCADHYHRYTIPKRNGKKRSIAAPKPVLKNAQRKILELILEKIVISNSAHGFLKGKSVISGADEHIKKPQLLINIDIKDFFPTVTFERVRGMFKSFGYSGFVSSLLAMLCTYCERMEIEVKGKKKYVKTSERILPQGSPASPMITNILCKRLDKRLNDVSLKYNCIYTRYADDMSFSFSTIDEAVLKRFIYDINCNVQYEGFKINKDKTRYLRRNNRQCITGIIINNKNIGVPKVWLKKLRAAIHNAAKSKENGALTFSMIHEISGMAAWLRLVNKERYEKIIREADKITGNS